MLWLGPARPGPAAARAAAPAARAAQGPSTSLRASVMKSSPFFFQSSAASMAARKTLTTFVPSAAETK